MPLFTDCTGSETQPAATCEERYTGCKSNTCVGSMQRYTGPPPVPLQIGLEDTKEDRYQTLWYLISSPFRKS